MFFIGSTVAHPTITLLKDKYDSALVNVINIEFDEVKKTNLYSQASAFQGYTLYSPDFSTSTYIINNDGDVLYTGESNFFPGHSVYLLENGNLLRTANLGIHPTFLITGGIGGGVQEFDLNNNLVWNFEYSDTYHVSHHDIEPLPNGNVLAIAWEYKTENEAIAKGRNPDLITNGQFWPDHIIEVEPTGPNSGDIVWEWHVWDHLIQDYDPSKENYGIVADHPELIDINYFTNLNILPDWLHSNSIDYNEELDQILVSVRNFNEIWIIDHSTTTEEAAGHTGGNNGKGGDLLYRWGNPKAYHAGTDADQKFFFQHDASWIESGCPGEGNILVFNNGVDRPGIEYSSVDEIIPPVDENGIYIYNGISYEPEAPIWNYSASNPEDFFSDLMSGAQRLPNGNTLICSTGEYVFFEVTPEKEIVWEYPVYIWTFNINRYAIDYPGIQELIPEPYKPNIPNGPTNGTIGVNYTYTTNTTDPNGDQMHYWFNWGDGTYSGWIGPFETGENCTATKTWDDVGLFEIKVIAKDIDGHVSVWSNPLLVNIELPNYPPNIPSNPDPYDGETKVDINMDLSWSGGDPNTGDIVTYDVYFEAGDPTPDILVSNDQLETTYNPGSMEFETHYYWKIVATDNHGESTNGPIWNFVTEDAPVNFPPDISIENPEDEATNVPLTLIELSINIADPDNDSFSWTIETSPYIGHSSGTYEQNGKKVCAITGILEFSTTYTWYVNATDTESGYITEKIYIFSTVINEPPDKPTLVGPTSLKPNEVGNFIFSAIDYDNDQVYFYIDWDDGNIVDWIGPYDSGEEINLTHSWTNKKKYVIRTQAKDVNELVSLWGTFEVSLPRTREIFSSVVWLRFLDMFPILERIIGLLR